MTQKNRKIGFVEYADDFNYYRAKVKYNSTSKGTFSLKMGLFSDDNC